MIKFISAAKVKSKAKQDDEEEGISDNECKVVKNSNNSRVQFLYQDDEEKDKMTRHIIANKFIYCKYAKVHTHTHKHA